MLEDKNEIIMLNPEVQTNCCYQDKNEYLCINLLNAMWLHVDGDVNCSGCSPLHRQNHEKHR